MYFCAKKIFERYFTMNNINTHSRGLIALTPLIVFMVSYLAVSLITGDFYKMPISVAFLIASVYAIAITRNIQNLQ